MSKQEIIEALRRLNALPGWKQLTVWQKVALLGLWSAHIYPLSRLLDTDEYGAWATWTFSKSFSEQQMLKAILDFASDPDGPARLADAVNRIPRPEPALIFHVFEVIKREEMPGKEAAQMIGLSCETLRRYGKDAATPLRLSTRMKLKQFIDRFEAEPTLAPETKPAEEPPVLDKRQLPVPVPPLRPDECDIRYEYTAAVHQRMADGAMTQTKRGIVLPSTARLTQEQEAWMLYIIRETAAHLLSTDVIVHISDRRRVTSSIVAPPSLK